MRKLAGMQPGQDFWLTIPRIEEPVRFQHDISRTRHDPEEEVRSVAARNGRYGSKGADVLPSEDQGITRIGPGFFPSFKRVHHDFRLERIRISRAHYVNERYNSRVFATILSHVSWSKPIARFALLSCSSVAGSSMIRVIARPSFAGSPGGTRSPVSSSTTTSLIPPTRVAITGVSHAIASRLMIPNGS